MNIYQQKRNVDEILAVLAEAVKKSEEDEKQRNLRS